MHDGTITFDYMPSQFITFRLETGYRYSDMPYWTGHGGITPPGGNNGSSADYQCAAGGDSGQRYGNLAAAESYCLGAGWPLRVGTKAHLVARPAHQPDREHDCDYGQVLAASCLAKARDLRPAC